jgi:hypothetical protein
MHKAQYDAGPRVAVSNDHEPGCSNESNFPVRTGWVADADASTMLNTYGLRLAKLNGWLHLVGSPDNDSTTDYYALEMKHADDGKLISQDDTSVEGDRLQLYLGANRTPRDKRWVYLLDIDCHGAGRLVYPKHIGGNRFPNDADTPKEFPLPDVGIMDVKKPFGVDTLLLISTQEPLPEPSELNFQGVRGGGSSDPLQRLLSGASEGRMRGGVTSVPTHWTIQSYTLKSIAKPASSGSTQ